MSSRRFVIFAAGLLALCATAAIVVYVGAGRAVNLAGFLGRGSQANLQIEDGFQVDVFASGLAGPRFMAVGPDGQLVVAERGGNRLVALPDADGDGRADRLHVIADDLNRPHSVVYHEGAWHVGVPTGVVRLTDEDGDGVADRREILIDDYPTRGHGTRTVAFLPDGRMIVSVGSSCNVCEETDPRRAALVVYDPPAASGPATGEAILARGLRNAVGLAIEPATGALWASNNGRDMMGDDLPPETIYRVEAGADYGWPRCHSGRLIDPDMGGPGACNGVAAPIVEMQAHSAPLGLTFYDGDQFPTDYRGDLFIAFHGSWNRSEPTGYKVVRLDFRDGVPATRVTDFVAGWLDPDDGTVSGRPVGVTVGADGALYVSDDKGGFIYRITYGEG